MADVAVRAAGTSSTSGTSSGGFRGWATRQRSWRRQRANTSAGAMPLEELVNNVSFAATCSIDSNSFCFAMTSSGMASITQSASCSLLQAVQDADWVIEAIPEDVIAKQKLFESIEQVAANDTLFTSSSSGIAPADVFARCRRQDRCLVAHPLNPPELVPLVELVPAARTATSAITRAQDYLRSLGRMPILLKKPIAGYVVGRIAASVWRQCIDLVLQGVIDVDDLDRAVSLGPALGWAAAGSQPTYHLAAGDEGGTLFLHQLVARFGGWG